MFVEFTCKNQVAVSMHLNLIRTLHAFVMGKFKPRTQI